MIAMRAPDVRMARWSSLVLRGNELMVRSSAVQYDEDGMIVTSGRGAVLLGFRATSGWMSGEVHVDIGDHVHYNVRVPADGIVPALFGTGALPFESLCREDIMVTAPPTADIEAVFAFICPDEYTNPYVPWTLRTPSGMTLLATNGQLWPVSDVRSLPPQYLFSSVPFLSSTAPSPSKSPNTA